VSGIAAHSWLWVVFALGLLQFVVLAARYVPARRAVRLPGYRQLLVVTSGLTCIAVLLAFAIRPGPWYGPLSLPPGFYIVIDPSYGAIVAVGAAIVSLGIAIAAIRDRPALALPRRLPALRGHVAGAWVPCPRDDPLPEGTVVAMPLANSRPTTPPRLHSTEAPRARWYQALAAGASSTPT